MQKWQKIINIILWYFFTILGAFYAKEYLILSSDPYLLTLTTFSIGALFIMFKMSFKELIGLLKCKNLLYLSLFNIGANFLTNISIDETSVSFTYMIKASEPVFVLLLSYLILGNIFPIKVYTTILPICFGVTMTATGEIAFSTTSLIAILIANLSNACRNVFFKSLKFESEEETIYPSICIVSFFMFLPVYMIKMLLSCHVSIFHLNSEMLYYLLQSASGSFLYNLFSFKVLTSLSPISHSILNIFKRVFTVMTSLIYFSKPLSHIQMTGMLIADLGVFFYSIIKMKSKETTITVSTKQIKLIKIVTACLVALTITGFVLNHPKSEIKCLQISPCHKSDAVIFYNNMKRVECIDKIRAQIRKTYSNIVPSNATVHLFDIPLHTNYGDSLIWLGEEILIKEFNSTIASYTSLYDFIPKKISLIKNVQESETILLHGGGNFGDIYYYHHLQRQNVLKQFPNNQIIMFPQTVNYRLKKRMANDSVVFRQHKNFTVSVRSYESYDFLTQYFPEIKAILVPDIAFMIGNIAPDADPTHDILILRRTDNEASFKAKKWESAYERYLKRYTYIDTDWFWHGHEKANYSSMPMLRLNLVNKIISKGKVIISDRLHASIFSLLIGRPHIIINDKYKKIENTRKFAFHDKPECAAEYLNEFYVDTPEEAVQLAVKILKVDS